MKSRRCDFGDIVISLQATAVCVLLVGLIGCASETAPTANSSGRISATYSGPAELSYCSTVRTFGTPVVITGSAVYYKRDTVAPDALGQNGGLGAAGSAQPIRYAEVRVTNSGGTEVQCGETDSSGNFSLTLPQGSSQFKIWVNARGNSSQVKASVLNRPELNTVYSLSTTVVTDSSKSVGTLSATVNGEILGAPFYIFDLIVKANEYLRAQLGSCSASVDQCVDFTVAPKLVAYWEAGFNPLSYFSTSGANSFYLPGYSRLFILGGVNGNTTRSDTDHFDPSIILHEYGHFLEDAFSNTDTPGGNHYGDRQIDPRLAWSEGWGNFIQAAILNSPYYIDTVGNIEGCTLSNINSCTDFNFYIPIEDVDSNCGTFAGCDEPEVADEGNFREFAVTRFLWDLIDTVNDSETVSGGLPELWTAMTSSSVGLKKSNIAFRDLGFVAQVQNTQLTHASGSSPINDWTSARTVSSVRADRREYAYYVEGDSSTCSTARNFTMTPYNDPNDDGGFSRPNWLRNNDFFHIYHSGGSLSLTLNYVSASGNCNDDLDLYLYDEDARYGSAGDIVADSENLPSTSFGSVQTESLSVSSLPAGNYLVNVKLFLSSTQCGSAKTSQGNINFEIISSVGGRLCPKTLP